MKRMKNRKGYSVLLLRFTVLLMLLYSCKEENTKPNILWIMAEDLSQDLGCYGNTVVKSPNIDKLAEEGMRFDNVFAAGPICSPSRTAMATGIYQTTLGAYHMRYYSEELIPDLPQDVKTIFQLLRENGYVTANIEDEFGKGKNDWMFKYDVEDNFDYTTWEELKESGQPFVAQINTKETHRGFKKADEKEFVGLKIPPYYPDHEVSREDWANYYKSIQKLDNDIGEIIKNLNESGLAENTIIIFMSDHGRPMLRGKSWLYDSGIEIPCIVKVPDNLKVNGYKEHSNNTNLISTIDISATILELAGIKQPANIQGRAFLGENRSEKREFIYAAVDRTGNIFFKSRCVRTERFKLIRNYNHDFSVKDASTAYRRAAHPIYHLVDIYEQRGLLTNIQKNLVKKLDYEELYDVVNDPYETINLTDNPNYQETLKDMQKLMDDYLIEIDDKGVYEVDSDELAKTFEEYGVNSAKGRASKYKQQREYVLRKIEHER